MPASHTRDLSVKHTKKAQWEVAARKRAHLTRDADSVVAAAVRRAKPPRLRAQIVYVVYDSAPLAAFATLNEAMTFVETQRDPRRYAITRLGVSKLYATRRTKEPRDTVTKLRERGEMIGRTAERTKKR